MSAAKPKSVAFSFRLDLASGVPAFEIVRTGLGVGLDLDTDNTALAILGDEIDFDAGGGAVVHEFTSRAGPCALLPASGVISSTKWMKLHHFEH